MQLHFRCSLDSIVSRIRASTVGHIHIGSELWRQRRVISCRTMAYMTYYLLTLWARVLLEKLTGFQLVKKFPAFYGTRRFITAFTSTRHLSLSWASSIQSIPNLPLPEDPSYMTVGLLVARRDSCRTRHLNAASLDMSVATIVDTTIWHTVGAHINARFKFAVLVLRLCTAWYLNLLISGCAG
jgi:hypothetical protein